jgi:hypothetical protein
MARMQSRKDPMKENLTQGIPGRLLELLSQGKRELTASVRAIIENLKDGTATFHPSIRMLARVFDYKSYTLARRDILACLGESEKELWSRTTEAKARDKAVASFICTQQNMLLAGKLVEPLKLLEISDLFDLSSVVSSTIYHRLRKLDLTPTISQQEAARERAIALFSLHVCAIVKRGRSWIPRRSIYFLYSLSTVS